MTLEREELIRIGQAVKMLWETIDVNFPGHLPPLETTPGAVEAMETMARVIYAAGPVEAAR